MKTSMQDFVGRSGLVFLPLFAGIAIRAIIFSTNAHRVLQSRPEISTPLTAWRDLQEGVFSNLQGQDPYKSGHFHHSRLCLLFFTYIIPYRSALATAITWIGADLLGCWALLKFARSTIPAPRMESWSAMIICSYLLNPYVIAACGARSTGSLDNALMLAAIAEASRGRRGISMVLVTLAAQSSWSSYFLVPVIMSMARLRDAEDRKGRQTNFVDYACAGAALSLGIASVFMLDTSSFRFEDLTPNSGMWWYFFTEMFDHFRPFFTWVFNLHSITYILPLCLRPFQQSSTRILVLLGTVAVWKPYPSISDTGLWLAVLGCHPRILAQLKHPLFTLTVYLYTAMLLPLLHALWLLTGTGNANFFYAATMVYGLNSSLAIMDVLNGALRADFQDALSGKVGVRAEESKPDIVQLARS